MMKGNEDMKTEKPYMMTLINGLMYLLVISYILPAGIIGGISIQRILIYAILLLGVAVVIRRNSFKELIKRFKAEIVVIGAGVVWWIGSSLKGEEYGTQFFSLLYVTVFMFIAVEIFIRSDILNLDFLVKCILIMLFGKILEKIGIEILFLLDMIQYEQVGSLYVEWFGTSVTTMTMEVGSLEFVRVQSSSDAVLFFLSPFLWFLPQIKKGIRAALFLGTGIFAVIVFSRLYLVQFFSFGLIAVVFYGKQMQKKVKMAAAGVFVVSAFFWIRPVTELIRIRFFSDSVSESDSIRMEQLSRFVEAIPDHLWLGNGMGSYLPDYLRSTEAPFSYELEYLSFLYQLGIIGFIFIIVGTLYLYIKHIYEYFQYNQKIIQILTLAAGLWYLIRPLFNPAFLGKQNGFIVIGILIINAYCYKKETSVS